MADENVDDNHPIQPPVAAEHLAEDVAVYAIQFHFDGPFDHVANSRHSSYMLEAQRLASFEDWPIALEQKPKELSEAGFFYTGQGDRVCCFSCSLGLKNWVVGDVPWEQHAMYNRNCDYLQLMKGTEFIDEQQSIRAAVDESLKLQEIAAIELASAQVEEEKVEEPNLMNRPNICKICFETEYNTAFFPCGHAIACAMCASSVINCPACRQLFTSVKRIYLS